MSPRLPRASRSRRRRHRASLVAILEELAPALAGRAPGHDRDGSFPFASLAELQASGVLAAPVPAEFGGLGVTRLHDLVVAAATLARADASLAIGVNMHVVLVHALERVRAHQAARGRRNRSDAVLRDVATGTTIMAAAISERGQVLGRPSTRATATPDGWLVEGGKIFCTLSPAATVLQTAVSYVTDSGEERYAYVPIPIDLPGVVVHDDWDALGMRASGSHSVTFAGVELPRDALRGGSRSATTARTCNEPRRRPPHAAASLGVAEAATQAVRAGRAGRSGCRARGRERDRPCRHAVDRRPCGNARRRGGGGHRDAVRRGAGGEGVRERGRRRGSPTGPSRCPVAPAKQRSSPLARHYRDARAGAFMHPLGANRAYDFLGQLMLGREPSVA